MPGMETSASHQSNLTDAIVIDHTELSDDDPADGDLTVYDIQEAAQPPVYDSFYHECWDDAARRLQRVKSYDYADAYRTALGGLHGHDIRKSKLSREMVAGCMAALNVWTKVQAIRV